ncbi:hypothetical protein BKA69DRAFT_612897 [Paraphysoderma sedebokerense]|nr:hypothetical protein BKA69DRAFT_612897 [Paraphysoderma sedebokerense]
MNASSASVDEAREKYLRLKRKQEYLFKLKIRLVQEKNKSKASSKGTTENGQKSGTSTDHTKSKPSQRLSNDSSTVEIGVMRTDNVVSATPKVDTLLKESTSLGQNVDNTSPQNAQKDSRDELGSKSCMESAVENSAYLQEPEDASYMNDLVRENTNTNTKNPTTQPSVVTITDTTVPAIQTCTIRSSEFPMRQSNSQKSQKRRKTKTMDTRSITPRVTRSSSRSSNQRNNSVETIDAVVHALNPKIVEKTVKQLVPADFELPLDYRADRERAKWFLGIDSGNASGDNQDAKGSCTLSNSLLPKETPNSKMISTDQVSVEDKDCPMTNSASPSPPVDRIFSPESKVFHYDTETIVESESDTQPLPDSTNNSVTEVTETQFVSSRLSALSQKASDAQQDGTNSLATGSSQPTSPAACQTEYSSLLKFDSPAKGSNQATHEQLPSHSQHHQNTIPTISSPIYPKPAHTQHLLISPKEVNRESQNSSSSIETDADDMAHEPNGEVDRNSTGDPLLVNQTQTAAKMVVGNDVGLCDQVMENHSVVELKTDNVYLDRLCSDGVFTNLEAANVTKPSDTPTCDRVSLFTDSQPKSANLPADIKQLNVNTVENDDSFPIPGRNLHNMNHAQTFKSHNLSAIADFMISTQPNPFESDPNQYRTNVPSLQSFDRIQEAQVREFDQRTLEDSIFKVDAHGLPIPDGKVLGVVTSPDAKFIVVITDMDIIFWETSSGGGSSSSWVETWTIKRHCNKKSNQVPTILFHPSFPKVPIVVCTTSIHISTFTAKHAYISTINLQTKSFSDAYVDFLDVHNSDYDDDISGSVWHSTRDNGYPILWTAQNEITLGTYQKGQIGSVVFNDSFKSIVKTIEYPLPPKAYATSPAIDLSLTSDCKTELEYLIVLYHSSISIFNHSTKTYLYSQEFTIPHLFLHPSIHCSMITRQHSTLMASSADSEIPDSDTDPFIYIVSSTLPQSQKHFENSSSYMDTISDSFFLDLFSQSIHSDQYGHSHTDHLLLPYDEDISISWPKDISVVGMDSQGWFQINGFTTASDDFHSDGNPDMQPNLNMIENRESRETAEYDGYICFKYVSKRWALAVSKKKIIVLELPNFRVVYEMDGVLDDATACTIHPPQKKSRKESEFMQIVMGTCKYQGVFSFSIEV